MLDAHADALKEGTVPSMTKGRCGHKLGIGHKSFCRVAAHEHEGQKASHSRGKGLRTGEAAVAATAGATALRAAWLLFFLAFLVAKLVTLAGRGPEDARGPAAVCAAAARAPLGAPAAAAGADASCDLCVACCSVCNSCLHSAQSARDTTSRLKAIGILLLSPAMLEARMRAHQPKC